MAIRCDHVHTIKVPKFFFNFVLHIYRLKRHNRAKIIKKSEILFWLPNMTMVMYTYDVNYIKKKNCAANLPGEL